MNACCVSGVLFGGKIFRLSVFAGQACLNGGIISLGSGVPGFTDTVLCALNQTSK